jgi:type IV pilus assembly protein PilM
VAGLSFGNKRWPIAVDIATENVRMLQLAEDGDDVRVVGGGRHVLAHHDDAPEQRREEIVSVVRRMLREGGFKGRQAVTALPTSALNIKNVRLPQMSPEQLDQAVRAEAEERFAFPVSGNQLNYLNAGQVRSGNEIRNEIIMMAVPEEAIDEHLAMLAEMGLTPVCIEAEPVALFRNRERFLRRQADMDAVSVLADIGAAGSRVVVARGRDIVFMKHVDIGARRMTGSVARHLNLDYREAHELRLRSVRGSGPGAEGVGRRDEDTERHLRDRSSIDWTINDAIRGEVEELAREISLCLRYCSVTFRGLRPKDIVLTGGATSDPSFVEMLSEHVNLECTVGQPFRHVDTDGATLGDSPRGLLSDWALCMGMALLRADLSMHGQEDDDATRRLSA